MTALTYIPAAISVAAFVAYMICVAAFYDLIWMPSLLMVAVFPALTWFLGGWVLGLVQLVYGAARRRSHPVASGALTLAMHGMFMLALSTGWIITV